MVEVFHEQFGQLDEIDHVGRGVLGHRLGQRTLQPVGARVALRQIHFQGLAQQRRQADLLASPRQRGTDRRIEQRRRNDTVLISQTLLILLGGVSDLHDVRTCQDIQQRLHVLLRYRERIDEPGVLRVG